MTKITTIDTTNADSFIVNGVAVIPKGITSIGDSAFFNSKLTSVTIPDSVTSIGNYAFANNELTSVTIPDSVTDIGDGAFKYNKLTSVTIPDSVTSIGNFAFTYNRLTSVAIPNSVTSIGNGAFKNNELTSITIPDSITDIRNFVFSYNKLTSISIPDSVTSIQFFAFYNNKLTSITIPDSVTFIGDGAFAYNQLTDVTIPDSITNIGNYVFQEGINLTGTPDTIVLDIQPQKTVTTIQLDTPISVGTLQFTQAIVGTTKRDKITGTDQGEIIAGGGGKNRLTGGGGPDAFLFQTPDGFGRKTADRITDFSSEGGDKMAISRDAFENVKRVRFKVASGKRDLQKAGRSNANFVYDDKSGMLYYDANGKKKGWGDGGAFAKLLGVPDVERSDFIIL